MTFVSNDDIERVNRDIFNLLSVFVDRFISDTEDCIASEEIDGHPLNSGDINKSISLLWVLQIGLRKCLRVEFVCFVKVFPLKALTVDFVNLVELESRLRLERSKGSNCLRRERTTINKEKNPSTNA